MVTLSVLYVLFIVINPFKVAGTVPSESMAPFRLSVALASCFLGKPLGFSERPKREVWFGYRICLLDWEEILSTMYPETLPPEAIQAVRLLLPQGYILLLRDVSCLLHHRPSLEPKAWN